jgi:type II secretory pathway component PulM
LILELYFLRMKLGWKKKLFVIVGIILSVIVIVYVILILVMDKPPIEEFDSCQLILSKAKKVNADVYSPEYYKASEKKYQAALRKQTLHQVQTRIP